MRTWLNILCSLPLILAGCLSGANRTAASGSPDAAFCVPAADDAALAKALAHFAQGLLLVGEEGPDSAGALESYRQAFAADPGNHDLASRVAVSALHRKDPPSAIEALDASYRINPSDYRRTVDLAAVYQTAERFDDALVYYRKSIAIDDSPTAVYIAMAGILFLQSGDKEALAVLEQGHLKADEPRLIGLYLFDQARRFITHGAFSRAIACFELLKTWEEVRKPDVHLILAELYSATDSGAKTVAVLQEARELPDPSPDVFTALAFAMLKNGNPAEAETVLDAARSRFPDAPNVLFAIGVVYGEMGRHEQTIALLTEARTRLAKTADGETPPALSEAFFLQLGAAYERLDRNDEAEAVFEECLTLYPDSHRVLNYLAYMWAEDNRNLEQALKYSVRSLVLEPDNAAYTDTLGWIQFRMKQYELAFETVTKARLLAGDDPEILLHLGDILAALGKLDDALALWKKSAEGDPSPSNRAIEQLILHRHPVPGQE